MDGCKPLGGGQSATQTKLFIEVGRSGRLTRGNTGLTTLGFTAQNYMMMHCFSNVHSI